jgi:tRNA A-37 threonylcarbamoyl transferase component Bud32
LAEIAPGTVLGERFEVVGILGRGGMATVWLAVDRLRGERIALKVLHDHLAAQPSMRARLRREVLAAARLRHPRALVAHELHELDGQLALSMPLHPGRTLIDHVHAHGPLDADALTDLATGLAGALAEAHRQGVVHRDVTPNNVLVDDNGRQGVLSDFGLVRLDDQRTGTATAALGTAGYAAPEVYQGVRADPRSDVYGLGAVLFFAATGRAPFDAPTPMGVLQKQISDEVPVLRSLRPDLPPFLADTIDAMIRRDPEARPQGASEVLDAIDSQAGLPEEEEESVTNPGLGLPAGDFTVVVVERRQDRQRRHNLRRMRRRLERQDPGASLERWFMSLTAGFKALMGLEARSPEEHLAHAVAREAGLPDGALVVTPELLDTRFRLVEAVERDSAARLADAAREAGFRAEVRPVDAAQADVPEPNPILRIVTIVAFIVFVMSVVGVVIGEAPPWFFFFGVFAFPFAWTRRAQLEDHSRLPVAYRPDLRPYLAEVHTHLKAALAPPRREAAPTPSAREKVKAQPPRKGEPVQTDPAQAVVERTEARLEGLLADIEQSTALGDVVLRDLKGTIYGLKEHTKALGLEASRLRVELQRRNDTAELAAASRIEARLERLRTLERAGDRVNAEEIASLERALAAHREKIALAEEGEVRLTRIMGSLLEIGASAARCARMLRQEREAHSAERLLDQLHREAAMAELTLREVDPPLRRAQLADESPSGVRRALRQPTGGERVR